MAELSVVEGTLGLNVLTLNIFKTSHSAIITCKLKKASVDINAPGQIVLPQPVKLSKGMGLLVQVQD